MTKKTPTFEHVTCGRCGGTGSYSFNMMHGSRCYGCNGSGFKLTKRGRAAQAYLSSLRQIPAKDFVVGDLIYAEFMSSAGFYRIESITPKRRPVSTPEGWDYENGQEVLAFRAHNTKLGYLDIETFPEALHRKGFPGDVKAAQVAEALRYQATLTASGTVKKGKT